MSLNETAIHNPDFPETFYTVPPLWCKTAVSTPSAGRRATQGHHPSLPAIFTFLKLTTSGLSRLTACRPRRTTRHIGRSRGAWKWFAGRAYQGIAPLTLATVPAPDRSRLGPVQPVRVAEAARGPAAPVPDLGPVTEISARALFADRSKSIRHQLLSPTPCYQECRPIRRHPH